MLAHWLGFRLGLDINLSRSFVEVGVAVIAPKIVYAL
jgi:hypothetical protein